jgi:peroxiredoxin
MAIAVGTVAPDFTLEDQDKAKFSLADLKGRKNVVLLFYPLDWSPTCEKENCSLAGDFGVVSDAQTEVVALSRDSTWSHKAWAGAKGIKHRLLADVNLEVADKYDLRHPAKFISHRATVIVDKAGKVAFAQVQQSTGDARDMKAVKDALSQLA